MKAERLKEPPRFMPIQITLDTQPEIDAFHALLRHNTVLTALHLEEGTNSVFNLLSKYASPNAEVLFTRLSNKMRE